MTEKRPMTDDRLEHLPEHEIDGDDIAGGEAPAIGRDAGAEGDTDEDVLEELDGDAVGDDTRPGLGIEADEGDPEDVNPAPTFHA
jgi:hypothetical protein